MEPKFKHQPREFQKQLLVQIEIEKTKNLTFLGLYCKKI